MGLIKDRLASLNINAYSPDESVNANLSRTNGIHVELAERIAEFHTEETLEAQIEAALTAAMDGYGQAIEMIREEKYGAQPPRDPEAPVSERFKAFHEAGDALKAAGTSPRKYVVIEWHGRGEFLVVLKPGTLSKLDDADLASEVNAAVSKAADEYSRQVSQLHKTVYQPKHFNPGGSR